VRRALNPEVIVAVIAVAAGCGLRLWAVFTPLGVMDADEAVVGLMARDWIDGRATVFYWGQNYSGSQESILVALLYAVATGLPEIAKLAPAGLHAGGAILVWRIGRRMVGARPALVAASLFWVWPAAFVWWSLKVRGHYGTTLVLGLLALLLVLQLVDDDLTAVRRRLVATGLGLAAGLGWWASFHIVFLVVPAGLWLVARRGRAAITDVIWAAPAGVFGALPWVVWNITHSFGSFRSPPVVAAGPAYSGRVTAFVTDAFPKAIGATVPFSENWAVPVVGQLLVAGVGLAVGLAAAAAIRRRDPHLSLLVAIAAAYPFLLALSPFFYVDEPRYLYYLAPVLALLVARAVTVPRSPSASSPPSTMRAAVPAVVVVAAFALSLTTLQTMATQRMGLFAAGGVEVPRRLDPLIADLEARGIRHVFAPYAMAYRLTLDSGRDVVATPIEHVRDPDLNEEVRSADRPAWVFMARSGQVAEFQQAAAVRGVRPGCSVTGDFAICHPDARLLQEDVPELQP